MFENLQIADNKIFNIRIAALNRFSITTVSRSKFDFLLNGIANSIRN